MPEESLQNKIPKNTKRTRKWLWRTAIVIVIAAIICCLLWKAGLLEFQTIDEQLAAIKAAHAIPDEENAAIIYNKLLENYDESALSPDFLDDDLDDLTRREPWLSKDYPELAEWLKDQQDTISKLLQASKKEKCRFPIIIDVQPMSPRTVRLIAMRRWAYLLVRAANNDIAEGRIDTGIQKYQCLIKMGNHQCQQPVWVDLLVGIAVEEIALHQMVSFIVEGDLTEEHLSTIEAALPHTKDNWSKDSAAVLEVERLYERKQSSFISRLRLWWWDIDEEVLNRIHEIYLRRLTDRHGNRILIALKRYKNKTGHWPESLDVIQSSLKTEIFVDPFNNGSFVYKLTDDSFKLYSKGKNNIDEDGKYKRRYGETSEGDDWLIWPPRSRKPKVKEENKNVEQQ
jgi:hypothetical protein